MLILGEDTFVEHDAPAVLMLRARPTALSVTVQVFHRLVGVGNVDHLTADRARQRSRHSSMIDGVPLPGQGPKPPTRGTDLPTAASPRALTRRDLGPCPELPPSPKIVR